MNRPEGRRPRAHLAMLTLLFTELLPVMVAAGVVNEYTRPSSRSAKRPITA